MKELSCSDFLFTFVRSYEERKILRRMGGSQPGYLHFLDRLPTADQRLRRSKIQVIRITRGSGKAFASSPYTYIKRSAPSPAKTIPGADAPLPTAVAENSLAVDAACSGNPGAMEYREYTSPAVRKSFTSGRCMEPTISANSSPLSTDLPC